MVQGQQIAVGVREERLVTDPGVEHVAAELDPQRTELRPVRRTFSTCSAIIVLLRSKAKPKASDCITARVKLPAWNSRAGQFPTS